MRHAVPLLLLSLLTAPRAHATDADKPRVLMVVADKDFFDPEYTLPRAALEGAGYRVEVASPSGTRAKGLAGLALDPDLSIASARAERYASLLLVGGYGAAQFYGDQALIALIRAFHAQKKVIGAQCYAPVVVAEAGLLQGENATSWSSQSGLLEQKGARYTGTPVEVSGTIVTGAAGSDANIRAFTDRYLAILTGASGAPGSPAGEAKAGGADRDRRRNGPFTLSEDRRRFTMVHAGLTRRGEVFAPATLDRSAPVSLLVGLHGRGSSGAALQSTGLDAHAARLNFVMLYPDAAAADWEVEPGSTGPADDLGFLRRLVTEATAAFGADPRRVYVTGHSMGGFMSYRVGIELSELVAAIAPVSGVLVAPGGAPNTGGARPVALLHQHAADDAVVPLKGFPGYSLSVKEALAYWARRNGARAPATTVRLEEGVSAVRYTGGEAPVQGVTYAGGGHAWVPGTTDRVMEFFYENPPRAARVTLEAAKLPGLLNEPRAITVTPIVEARTPVARVELVASGRVLASSSAAPYRLTFTPRMLQTYGLELVATLSDGTRVVSPRMHRLTVVPKNLARRSQASSSSDESASLAAGRAVDGDFTTRWSSAHEDGQSITVDLGSPREVQAVTLFWEIARAASYRLEGSADGSTWKTLFSQPASRGEVEVDTFARERVRWVRLVSEKRATPWGVSLWELMVH